MSPEEIRQRAIEDLGAFFAELNRESDRGLALVGGAVLDDRLLETLRSFLCELPVAGRLLDEPNSPLGTFSARADACVALGLIDEAEHAEIALIRKIRNEFAHGKHGLTFATEKVAGLCSTLKSPLPEGEGIKANDPRFRFRNAVVTLLVRLYYRPKWVEKERRSVKEWVSADHVRWRSVDEELPPPGAPVIALGRPPGK